MSTSIMAQGIFIDLGKTETGRYMNLVGNTGDGAIQNTFIDPEYCAQNVGTTMYFTIDDNYMFQRAAGTFTIVNVEYYDAPNVEIKLVYDAIGNPAMEYPLTIKTAGSNSWKSFNFFVDDAYFGNGMTNNADLSLVAANGTMSINAVKVIPIDFYIDFNGTTSGGVDTPNNDEYFIVQKEVQGGDSKTEYVTVEGEECIAPTLGTQYLYCDVDDSMVYGGNHPNMFIAVEYYDENPQWSMRIQYDSETARYQNTATISGKGWNSFRTHTYEVSNANFANRENGQSDFRLALSDAGMKINRITVGLLEVEPLPITTNLPDMNAYKALESPTVDGTLLDWDWLNEMDIEPEFDDDGKRADEYYRTWLLNPENVPIVEAGEPGVVDPGVAGLWDTADLGGGVRVLWDDANLYFTLTIVDNVMDVDGASWKEKDGFGFYIDVSHNYAAGPTGQIAVPKRDDLSFQQGEHFIFLPASESDLGSWVHQGVEGGEALPTNVLKKVVTTDSGYVMEVSIPLDLLREGLTWTPNDDSQDDFNPLFSFVLNDADAVGAESGRLMWGGHSADDEFWGRLNIEGIPLVDRGLTIDFGVSNFEQFLVQTEKGGDGLTEVVEKGGKNCAKLSNGYLYLDIDDDVISNGNHPHVLISCEYFDGETEKFRIQYDAFDAPYKDTDWITVGSTGTWKTKIVEITDAKFAGSQNGKADFRIHCPDNNLHLNQVRVGIADLWIDLGETVTGFGIVESQLGSDGVRKVATVGGVECKRNTRGDVENTRYFYHRVADSLIYAGSHPEIFLTVEYYDTTSSGGIMINYDGATTQWSDSKSTAFITGSNQWKLHTFYLDDAWFANRENGASDFRARGEGDGPTYINRILIGSTTPIYTSVSDEMEMPFSFRLDQNYPNPFNPSTTIQYEIAKTEHVSLKIYNIRGQLVRILVNSVQVSGSYTSNWDGRDSRGMTVPSGLYIYRFTAGDYIKSYKMMLVK